ncbi:MAG: hypothetical protein JWO60_2785 [Frankiales bacterium]|nr:hypothetical protein [Frankiales bacterium]
MVVLGLLLRVACVFALLFAVLAVLKRTEGFRAARRTNPVQVLGSTRVGKGAALTMVRIGDAEYVLGVTDHSVTLITPATPVEQPAAVEEPVVAAVAGPKPDFAAALGARLGGLVGTPAAAGVAQVPPTPAEFLKSAYRVARRRPAESTDLSTDAVTAALASVRGDEPVAPVTVPAPRTTSETSPAAADGPAAPTPRHALRRAVARTEALRHQEHSWTRSSRPSARTSELDVALG